jgi:hypothetical protein
MASRQRAATISKESKESWKVIKQKQNSFLYPWSGPIPVVTINGAPYELGLEHGTKCKERIPKTVEETWGGLLEYLGCKKSDIIEDLQVYSKKIRDCHPSFGKEMEGVADGAKVSYDDIVLLNSQINILHERGGLKGLEGLLCSSLTSWGRRQLMGA